MPKPLPPAEPVLAKVPSIECQPRIVWHWALVLLVSFAVAIHGARPFAGSWNDGSRLATVESLGDYGTFCIDDSIFTRIPTRARPFKHTPYFPGSGNGTRDKLLINGRYYSDKPFVPAVLMAAFYKMGRLLGMPAAANRPDVFCFWATVATSGLAYVMAVGGIYRLSELAGLHPYGRLLLAASFAFSTVALPYVRHVNSHIVFLAVMVALMVDLVLLSQQSAMGSVSWRRLGITGTLAGFAYATDTGIGADLLICLVPLIVYRYRRPAGLAMFALSLIPWLVVTHGLNYAIGGYFKPLNTVSEYISYPGSAFGAENMTGIWHHHDVGEFASYAIDLLFGADNSIPEQPQMRGFFLHNLPLFLALIALPYFLLRPAGHWPEVAFSGCFCGGMWLQYALLSNNFSGICCSVRWFVPWLAPGFLLIAWFLRRFPSFWVDFSILSVGGAYLAMAMWKFGPWLEVPYATQEPIQFTTLVAWAAGRLGVFAFWPSRTSGS